MDLTVVLPGESVSFQTENVVWNSVGEAGTDLSVNGVRVEPDSFSSAGNHFLVYWQSESLIMNQNFHN